MKTVLSELFESFDNLRFPESLRISVQFGILMSFLRKSGIKSQIFEIFEKSLHSIFCHVYDVNFIQLWQKLRALIRLASKVLLKTKIFNEITCQLVKTSLSVKLIVSI